MLEAANVGGAEPSRQVGVFAEGLQLTRPAGFGGEVDLGVQGSTDADGGVFLASDVTETLDEFGILGRGKAERLGPL
ncbi:hypothetical protein GCM10010459_16010 [Microbacterium schleiferi]